MPIILIRELNATENGFEVELTFDAQGDYPITIQDPFSAKQEQELEWYFEDWLRMPFTDQVIAQRAAASVRTYGENLFEQVFGDRHAYGHYLLCRDRMSEVVIEIQGRSPGFQALHWEALWEKGQPRPLAVDAVMVRKDGRSSRSAMQVREASPVLRLLVVTARPDEESDVGYRTISRPLIEAIRNAQVPVAVELLRPGTYEALSRHLEEKGEGYYHIVHFDAHGGLMSYGQLQGRVERNRYLYQARYGQVDLQPYEGVKAFLLFEGADKGKADPVEAGELADLLTGKGIPVCILNACQSAKSTLTPSSVGANDGSPSPSDALDLPTDARETSLGNRLMAAGMQMVVAMGYSVSVTAAQILMESLYRQLMSQKALPQAIRLGRKELFNRKNRRAYFNQQIDLEDWLLPVVYTSGAVQLNLREFRPEEAEYYYAAAGERFQFTQPTYGFMGRDLEILKIEKALLRHNVLLLQGMGGTGKTTLLNYLREWWQTTHFVKEVFYFGYDERAWTLEQILHEVGKRVYGRFEQAAFQAMKVEAQTQKLVQTLRSGNFGLILDNLESVTGQQLAIQNTLNEQGQRKLRDFLQRLAGGGTKVVLGSRGSEGWLAGVYKVNRYTLQGLDPESRSVLAEKILERQVKEAQRIEAIQKDQDFQRLMKLLAGYPLAMEVVLANLARQSPGEILTALDEADVALDSGSRDKTESILKCVEYSHSNLSPTTQKLLVCLAPFNGFFWRDGVPEYAKKLQQLESFQDWDFSEFDLAIQEAIDWGLLSPFHEDDMDQTSLRIQPIFPFFLKSKLKELSPLVQDDLWKGFANYYRELADHYLSLMQSKDADERQWGQSSCQLEYENLYSALQHCLQEKNNFEIWQCLGRYLGLIHNPSEELAFYEQLYQALQSYDKERLTHEFPEGLIKVLGDRANAYSKMKQYTKAKEAYLTILKQIADASLESQTQNYFMANTYQQLGRVSHDLHEYENAQQFYQRALDIDLEHYNQCIRGDIFHGFGYLMQDLQEYEQAQKFYQQALEIKENCGDYHSQAITYHHLGWTRHSLEDYEKAKEDYEKALNIFDEYGDRYSQACTYHHLGWLSEDSQEYDEAKEYYQKSLEIKIKFGDLYGQASTYQGLGSVSQELHEYTQAYKYYQQALNIFVGYRDRYSQAKIYGTLGILAEKQKDYEQAISNHLQALKIFAELRDNDCIASINSYLAHLYQITQSKAMIDAISVLFNITTEEAEAMLQQNET